VYTARPVTFSGASSRGAAASAASKRPAHASITAAMIPT
jgi:hypothetical protein